MKVLHVIGGIAWRYGGTTHTVVSLCNALARQKDVIAEIAATDADGPCDRLTTVTRPKLSVPLHLFRRDFSEQWKFSLGMLRWFRQRLSEFDLVHIHGIWSFATTAAAITARQQGIPYVILPQGMLSPYTWSRSWLVKRAYWWLAERQNIERATRLIAASTGELDEITRLGVNSRVTRIPLGLDEDAWQAPRHPEALRQACQGRDRGRPIVLYLSRLHPKKGLAEFLLPALKELGSDVFLAIAGGMDASSGAYRSFVEEEIQRLGLSDQVALLGAIPPKDRWALFDGADAFALPSQNENFGLVVLEAMARGCPVIVFRGVHAGEHVTKCNAGFVVDPQIPALVAALKSLLSDESGRHEMGRRGAAYASRLSWNQIAERVLELYRECLRPGPVFRPARMCALPLKLQLDDRSWN